MSTGGKPGAGGYLASIESASAVLPPASLAVAWVDIASLRKSDVWQNVLGLGGEKVGSLPLATVVEHTDHAVLAVYPSAAGLESLVLVEGPFDADEAFDLVKAWAAGGGVEAEAAEIRQRRALRIKGQTFIRLAGSLYASGPEVLTAYCADLLDEKKTASSSSTSLAYLFKKSRIQQSSLDAFFRIPPVANDWLKAKKIDSLIGGSLLLSLRYGDTVSFHLGVLPGKDIRPIWLANEINTFFVRAAKDGRLKKLQLEKWVEELDAKLLDKGVVVKGDINKEKLLEALRQFLHLKTPADDGAAGQDNEEEQDEEEPKGGET